MCRLPRHRPLSRAKGATHTKAATCCKTLDREVQALVKERNELKVKVEWQFSISQAWEKLSRHYKNVKSKN